MEEGFGESPSPSRGFVSGADIRREIYARLLQTGNAEAIADPNFSTLLDAHFNRLPASYGLDVSVDRAEDVLLHQKVLAEAKDPRKRPAFYVRYLKTIVDDDHEVQQSARVCPTSGRCKNIGDEDFPSNSRIKDFEVDFEPCSKLEDLNLGVKRNDGPGNGRYFECHTSRRQDIAQIPIHEIVFSTLDKPKLLTKLSALLSDIGLNIREAHVFSTTDGYSLDVFVVDGWAEKGIDGLQTELKKAIARSEGSWSGSSRSSATEKIVAVQTKVGDWEIEKRLLKMGIVELTWGRMLL